MDTWLYDIATVMKVLGGSATLQQIYRAVRERRENQPPEWRAEIRSTIYRHSKDSPAYVPGNPDMFRSVGRGEWGLRFPGDPTVGKKSDFHPMVLAFDVVMSSMSKEELDSLQRSGKLKETVERKAEEIRNRYRLT